MTRRHEEEADNIRSATQAAQILVSIFKHIDDKLSETKQQLSEISERSRTAVQVPQFVDWLKAQGKASWTIKQNKNYAIKYGHILDTGDASVLMTLSPRNRHHALSALASLSKFSGQYGQFVQIRQNYNLRWTTGADAFQVLQRFFNTALSLDVMIQKIKEMIRLLPPFMGKIIKFGCLVGLRPSECVESVRLINTLVSKDTKVSSKEETLNYYYNPDRSALEHFRFPEIFLRQTKKAFISFVTPEILESVRYTEQLPTYNQIRLACWSAAIKCDMRFCRKIFASHLRNEGIQPEVIDLLQGRVSQSVLTRHYLTPSNDLKDKILASLDRLKQAIES